MRLYEKVFNKIKSRYVNRIVFPKEIAKKQPIYMSFRTKCSGLRRGCIEIESDAIYAGMIGYGINTIAGLARNEKSYLSFSPDGKMIFEGIAHFSRGVSIVVAQNGLLRIGNNIYANSGCMIRCRNSITIGSDNMWGWDVVLMDGDGHPIRNEENEIINYDKPISIGDKVWLGSYTKVLKGASIQDGCVVGLGSTVTGKNEHQNSILVGCPAKEKKQNCDWDRGEFPIA